MATIPYVILRDLLGKPVDDPAVIEVLAKAGKVRTDADFIVAKEAGFDFALRRPAGAKARSKKLLSTLFLWPEGVNKHRGYAGLPAPLAFGASRAALLAALPRPIVTWKIGPGKVPVGTKDVSHDTFAIDSVEVSVNYRDDACSSIQVTLPRP